MRVTIRYVEGCPHWQVADERVHAALARSGHTTADVVHELVDTHENAVRLGFVGSPTILIDGVDPFATADAARGLACRVYPTTAGPVGCPSVEQLVAELLLAARNVG